MSQFKIGTFEFINLDSAIGDPFESITLEARPGQDGYTLWQNGKRAQPITFQSVVNVVDLASAHALLLQYQAKVGQDPLTLVWGGIIRDSIRLGILGVQEVPRGLHATLTSVGGVLPPGTISRALLHAQWTVLPLAVQ